MTQVNSTNPANPDDSAPLESAPEPEKRGRRRRHRSPVRRVSKRVGRLFNWRIILIVVISVVAVFGVTTAALTADAISRVNDSLNGVRRVVESVSRNPSELTLTDFTRLKSSVTDLTRSLSNARQQTRLLQPFRRFNTDLDITLDALSATEQIANAARDMLAGLEPTLFFMVGAGGQDSVVAQISSGERIVELLRIGRGRFQSAERALEAAGRQLDELSITGASSDLLQNLNSLRGYHEQMVTLNGLLLEAPELLTVALGLDQTRTYLILSQNSDELRPSGGYISTFGYMSIRNGRILDYGYSPTSGTNPNPPPSTFSNEIAPPDWWIPFSTPMRTAWDGSWYADFSRTAEMARWYYDNGNNTQAPVSGVIGIDIVGFEYILEGLGSVQVPGYNVTVTPANFRQLVYDIRAFGQGVEPHKRFVAAIYQQIFGAWQTGRFTEAQSTALLAATLRALQEKHIMLYFADDSLNDAVDSLGWSGRQDTGEGYDYIMVADATLGNKSARSVVRQITYDAAIQDDGTVQGRATITYDYPASLADADPAVDPEYHGQLDYFSLMQFFVPNGTTLHSASDLVLNLQETESNNHTLLTGYVYVPYNGGERYQFNYTTPVVVEPYGDYYRYRLLLQKQPGMRAEPVSVQVTLPSNARLVSASPSPVASFTLEQTVLEFRATLTTDVWIDVIYGIAPPESAES